MAPTPEPPSTITLRIKVAPGHLADNVDEFTLGTQVPTSASIGQVRHRIQQTVPTNPSPERQRLLFGGRALVDNEQSLADALNTKLVPGQNEYVIHLLVKGEGAGTTPAVHRRGLNTPERSTSPAQTGSGDGTTQQQQPPMQPQPLELNQPLHNLPQHVHIHHQPGQNVPQWRFPPQIIHHGAHPLAGQVPLGAFPGHLVGQMPGVGPGLPHLGAHGQPGLPQGLRGVGAQEQQAGPLTEGNQQTQDPAAVNHSAATSDQQPPQPQPQNHQTTRLPNGQGVQFEGIGANGQRYTIHHQTLNLPTLGLPNAGSPFGITIPGLGGLPPFNMPPPTNPPSRPGPSALDESRQNVAEVMTELDRLETAATTDGQRQSITNLRERVQRLNDYIDPFRLGFQPTPRPGAPETSQSAFAMQAAATQQLLNRLQSRLPIPFPGLAQATHPHPGFTSEPNSSNPTCYLLSSPTGPHSILYTSQHGTYTTAQPSQLPNTDFHPTPTPTTNPPANPGPVADADDPAHVPDAAAGPAQVPAAAPGPAQDPMGALGPILGHFWLLLRVLIFTYFLLGSNMGWRRPLILLAIIVGFWLLRAGLFGEGAVLRRWWDGIVQVPGNAGGAARDGERGIGGNADGNGNGDGDGDGNVNVNARMPTPEEMARRLLDQDARQRRERMNWLRERVRPVERAAALFVASLWPGVGEAHVRAREQEERRRAEEEMAARRREEEERRGVEERAREKEGQQEKEKEGVQSEGNGEQGEGALGEGSGEKAGDAMG